MSTVEEIVQAINELPPEQRDEVRRQLLSLWNSSKSESHKLPMKRARPRRPPIKIKGKPLSETVVEDRR